MFTRATIFAGFVALAASAPAVTQIGDGQVQASSAVAKPTPVSQISDGQLQNGQTAVKPVPAPAATNSYSPLPYSYNQDPVTLLAAASSAASYAGVPISAIPGATNPVPRLINSRVTSTSHGPYSGPAPTVTGAVSNAPAGTAIPFLPPNPTALTYNPNGQLNSQQPVPYTPAGGLGTNGSEPVYRVQSDFDYQSILLGLYQEWIELDLFHDILAKFSEEEFTAAGLSASDRFLIQFMAEQEQGHALLLSNLLGGPGGATPSCTYNYPYTTVHEAFDFAQKLTRFGESGVYGFQAHLNAREVGQLLIQSIATEARQQQIFRQFSGLFPMPVWFEAGIPQSWAWTLLAPYISSCPAEAKRLVWQNFPALTVRNQPNSARENARQSGFGEVTGFGPAAPSSDKAAKDANDYCVGNNEEGFDCSAAISQNRSIPLSYPGRELFLSWEDKGKPVGPNLSYVTDTSAGAPAFVIWVNQLNTTFSALTNITKSNGLNYGQTIQPDVSTFEGDPAINGTMFIAITDGVYNYTAFDLANINPHVVAGPALYQSG